MTVVKDGNLWLNVDINDDGVPRFGAIRSKDIFEQAYRYFEARMMFQNTSGYWGTFWLMCGDVNRVGDDGVDGAEIDINESGYDHRYHKSWDSYVKLKDRDVRELFEG